MNTTIGQNTPAETLSQFTALQAEVTQMHLTGRLGTDQVAEILYEPDANAVGHFFINAYTIAPIHPAPLYRQLSLDEMRTLLVTLKAEEQRIPYELDPVLLHTFIHLLSQAIENQPSTRFANARFGKITRDAYGVIIGQFGLGVDIAGTIHDAHGIVTAEQHVVPMPPGPFQRLSPADRASLIVALEMLVNGSQPSADPLWVQVLNDLKK
jgi:hypothetical protein